MTQGGRRGARWVVGGVLGVAALVGVACSDSSSPPGATGPVSDAAASPPTRDSGDLVQGDALTPDELDTYHRGSDSAPSVLSLTNVADSLFDFDPTLSPSKDAAANASAIGAYVSSKLGAQ